MHDCSLPATPLRVCVIVNPNAGRKTVQKHLECIIGRLLLEGTASSVQVFRTAARGDATVEAARLKRDECDLLIGCGGDGTINEIINGLLQNGSDIPLAILAAGTSNDFAVSLKLPQNADDFCRMVQTGVCRHVDIGCGNGRYFINVAAFGMFTQVAHSTPQSTKNTLGLLAYYLNAIKEAPESLSRVMRLSIESEEYTGEGEYLLCMVVNSMSVASMRKLMYRADVSDGMFDVLLVKKKKILPRSEELLGSIQQAVEVLTALPPGEAFPKLREQQTEKDPDPAILYFQTRDIHIRTLDDTPVEVDLDGEAYGQLPLNIQVAHRALSLLVPYDGKKLPQNPAAAE